LDFLGRIDHQVKLHGHRIELGEIEAKISSLDLVAATAVVVQSGSGAGPRLAAFYSAPAQVTPADVREGLRHSLPEYMVPAFIRRVDALPLTSSGKIDRKTLESFHPADADFQSSLPRLSPLEMEVAALFAELLGISQIGPEDDFFDRGGHSLLAVRLLSRLKARFGSAPTIRDFFGAPTVRAVALSLQPAFSSGEAKGPARQ